MCTWAECRVCENDPLAAFPSSSSSPQSFKETLVGSPGKGGGASQRNKILIFLGQIFVLRIGCESSRLIQKLVYNHC
jgi:hypothetical protein